MMKIRSGETRPWPFQLRENGRPADLTGYQSVKLHLTNASTGVKKIDGAAATVDDAEGGKVEYTPSADDVDTTGIFEAVVEVEFLTFTAYFPSDDDDPARVLIGPAP